MDCLANIRYIVRSLYSPVGGLFSEFRQESQDDEPGSSSSTAEEVALVQPKTRCCSGRL